MVPSVRGHLGYLHSSPRDSALPWVNIPSHDLPIRFAGIVMPAWSIAL
jgi:hypothetical protein